MIGLNTRFSGVTSPLRMNDPSKLQQQGIRIVENGERRVIGSAAKNHWDFRNNTDQLRQHLNDIRFKKDIHHSREADDRF